MADDLSYPQIDPTHFDLIIVGTGLPESLIAAAASAVGKFVLHLDPNSSYGGQFSSFSLNDLTSFLDLQQGNKDDSHLPSSSASAVGNSNKVEVDLKTQYLHFDVEISFHGSSEDLRPSKKFSLDIFGPRVFFCAEPIMNLVQNSGVRHHVEFQSIDSCFVYVGNKMLIDVPHSRTALFRNTNLAPKNCALKEKKRLSMFFNLVHEYFNSNETMKQSRISNEDLESPFIDFLTKQGLMPNIKRMILYAIAMANYDQETVKDCKNLIKTKDGVEALALYRSSVGRFKDIKGDPIPGPFICSIYGQGELPQALCRTAAVKGALYVLDMPVRAVLFDKDNKQYKGIRLASGQEISSNHLVMGPSFLVPSESLLLPISEPQQELDDKSIVRDVIEKVARAVCIASASIVPDKKNVLVVFPPRSLYPGQITAVRALQLSSNVAVCPPNLFVWYLSSLCDDAAQGKESLHAAIGALQMGLTTDSWEKNDLVQNENGKPRITLLWSALYIQQLPKLQASTDAISFCPMPDVNLDYRKIFESSVEMFQKLYPREEFMPETNACENMENEEQHE